MTIDKRINYDYVAQDGVKNYVKDSKSVTVPEKFKARKNAPAVKLAYITDAEAKMLKKNKPGTPHKGPKGIPSYDSFDADGNFTSGAAMSAMESGSTSARDRAEVQASNYGAPRGAGPGVKTQAEQDLRSSIIAAGAGQRVNPGFFDSRNTVSPAELARAKAFNPAAFRAGRRGGIMDLFTGGGILGNIVRGVGQAFGLGKKYNEPTYDMSALSGLPFGGTAAFQNLDIRDKFNRLGDDEEEETTATGFVTTGTNYPGANKFKAPRKRITYGDTPVIQDYPTDEMFEEQFGNFNTIKPTNLNDYQGINSLKLETPKQQAEDDFLKDAMAELTDKQKRFIDSKKFPLQENLITPESVFETITDPNLGIYDTGTFGFGAQEPTTTEEYNDYLRSLGLTQIG